VNCTSATFDDIMISEVQSGEVHWIGLN
jgi:hypothetical protein